MVGDREVEPELQCSVMRVVQAAMGTEGSYLPTRKDAMMVSRRHLEPMLERQIVRREDKWRRTVSSKENNMCKVVAVTVDCLPTTNPHIFCW